jgi:sugar phosphate isomerase/epimerase
MRIKAVFAAGCVLLTVGGAAADDFEKGFATPSGLLGPVTLRASSVQAEPAFFPFCIDWHDAKKRGFAEQAAMLKELGYSGVGHIWLDKVEERLASLDAAGLRLCQITMQVSLAPDKPPYDRERFRQVLEAVKGRGVQFLLIMNGAKPSDYTQDGHAIELVREMSEWAKAGGSELLLYPHTGDWIERVEDAVRVAKQVDRPNVGVMFNLCHWLRVSPDRDYKTRLTEAMPYLRAVSLNGADERDGREGKPNWERYIQPLDSGTFDQAAFVKTLRELGYCGPVGLQCFGIGGDAREHLARSLTAWKTLNKDDVTVGAIRWDAWHTPVGASEQWPGGGPVKAMEASLNPHGYRHRAPFFARVDTNDTLCIDGYTQEIVDREIAFAKDGGLDYWAFLLYDEGTCMSQGLSLYLSSRCRRDVNFCAIASPGTFGGRDTWPAGIARVVRLMKEPGYQTVCGGRPLLYLFRPEEKWIQAWGGPAGARGLFDGLRQAARQAGLADPYVVVMDDSAAAQVKRAADTVGSNAISDYARQANGAGAPYSELASTAREFWRACAATGAEVVPLAMAGWDRRPRVEHPVPWETWQKPNVGLDKYYVLPTPEELAAHVGEAMAWAEQCPAKTVIIYAWNEHDEGGWLCPTLGADGRPDASRLRALAGMRRRRAEGQGALRGAQRAH